jgi:hypothetical protein
MNVFRIPGLTLFPTEGYGSTGRQGPISITGFPEGAKARPDLRVFRRN